MTIPLCCDFVTWQSIELMSIASQLFEPVEVAKIILLGKEAGLAVDAALNDVQRMMFCKQNAGAT